MTDKILIVNKEQVKKLRAKLGSIDEIDHCIEEVKKMIEIKSTLAWRADEGRICIGPGWAAQLQVEIRILEKSLRALEKGDILNAVLLLKELEKMIG